MSDETLHLPPELGETDDDAVAAAVLAERERILGLLELRRDTRGYEALITELIEDGSSVPVAAQRILQLQRDRGVELADLEAESQAVPHGGAPSDPREGSGSGWDRVARRFGGGGRDE